METIKQENKEEITSKILAIMQKNYNFFRGTNEAELHSSVEIAELFCPELSQPELKAVKTAEEIFMSPYKKAINPSEIKTK